jgi:hypothetical protein
VKGQKKSMDTSIILAFNHENHVIITYWSMNSDKAALFQWQQIGSRNNKYKAATG